MPTAGLLVPASHHSPAPTVGPIDRASITGIVLAGGRGTRMGGVDKGLVDFQGESLAARAVRQLAPQVGQVLISANRHRAAYERLGLVIADADAYETDEEIVHEASEDANKAANKPDDRARHGQIPFDGPLAGILSGLRAAKTPFLACVPCDCPFFPADLVARLSVPFADSACTLAIAYAPDPTADPDHPETMRAHPVFALMRTNLADALAEQLAAGERRLQSWCRRHTAVAVPFADMHAFYNVNTLQARDDAEAPTPCLSPPRRS